MSHICQRRDPALLERDLDRHRRRNGHLFPQLEATPDLSRGELRLAADVLLAMADGDDIPETAMMRALTIAETLAHG